ncbi:MAG: hypothetical protein QW604_04015 [Fervidicoccaceae archaeon]
MSKFEKLVVTVGYIYYPFESTTNLIHIYMIATQGSPIIQPATLWYLGKEITEKLNFNPHLKAYDDWDFGLCALELLGLNRLYYDYRVAALVSSILIKKKGYSRYLLEKLGIIKAVPKPYSQL